MIDPRQLHLVQLNEQEILNLNQMTLHPGFASLLKLLEGEATRATVDAISCTEPDKDMRLTLLDDARSTHRVVANFIRILNNYRAAALSEPAEEKPHDPLSDLLNLNLEVH